MAPTPLLAKGFGDVTRYWARQQPNAVAVKTAERTLSWSDLDNSTNELCAGLQERGVRTGDRVSVLLQNSAEYLELLVACYKLGVLFVPLNTRMTSAELQYVLTDASCSFVVTDTELLPVALDVKRSMDELQLFVTDAEGTPDAEPFEALRVSGGQDPDCLVTEDDVAMICYTSGTTGYPKGAMITHQNLEVQAVNRILIGGLTRRDSGLIVFPLSFTAGVVCFWAPTSMSGATTVIEREFEPGRTLRLIEGEPINWLMGVPYIWEQMATHERFPHTDVSSLRHAMSGGAPVPRPLIETWQARGVEMTQGYGLTEGSGFNLGLTEEDALRKLGSSGRPLLHTRIRIAREDGSNCDIGEVGELLISGPEVMAGYWNNERATAETIVEGWLHTGDMAVADEDGYVSIVDRKKDMLISGGINVYPAEIERVAYGFPGVTEAAVIGVADDRWGEVGTLIVYSQGDQLDTDGLVTHLNNELASYKIPRYLIRRDKPFPRNMASKVLKRELRQEHATLSDATRIR